MARIVDCMHMWIWHSIPLSVSESFLSQVYSSLYQYMRGNKFPHFCSQLNCAPLSLLTPLRKGEMLIAGVTLCAKQAILPLPARDVKSLVSHMVVGPLSVFKYELEGTFPDFEKWLMIFICPSWEAIKAPGFSEGNMFMFLRKSGSSNVSQLGYPKHVTPQIP